ncbi:MAG: C-GCAxxG-C-C family (seleno)protein [Chloroflexota bacterium]
MEQERLSAEARAKVERAGALAFEFEQKYGSCPQCVLQAIHEAVMPIGDDLFKASHVLAGGGALCGAGTCGALAGGLLAISSRFGRDRARFAKGRHLISYQRGKALYDRFVAEYGTPTCAGVQTSVFGRDYDMWDREQFQAFQEAGGHGDKCPNVASKVTQWAAEMLLADIEK